MSPLWNSFFAKIWPSPPGVIGLSFSKNDMVAVRVVREKLGYRIADIARESLPFSLFTNVMPSVEDCASLSQAMQRLAVSIPQTFWPLQIALPDPAAIFQIMEFDSIPQTSGEREAIAKFRLEKEFPAMTPMQCTTQVISNDREPRLLMALFIQRAWLDCLNEACRSAGLVPSVIDVTMNYLFNRFYDVVKASSGDGVLISVEPDAWSILFWDAAHRPRFVRSRWRDASAGTNEEYEDIARDTERLIMSYVLRVPGRKVYGIYLCANEDDCARLKARLDERMQIPCVQLDVTESFSVVQGLSSVQNIPPSVLAASVPRI